MGCVIGEIVSKGPGMGLYVYPSVGLGDARKGVSDLRRPVHSGWDIPRLPFAFQHLSGRPTLPTSFNATWRHQKRQKTLGFIFQGGACPISPLASLGTRDRCGFDIETRMEEAITKH